MDTSLSPSVIANLFMKNFENNAINTSLLKPKNQIRYVDNTFAIFPRGKEELNHLRYK